MSQNSLTLPTTGTVSGLQMTQHANNAIDTLATLSSGASAPSSPVAGQLWHDTTNHVLKLRNQANSGWIALFAVNESGGVAVPSSSVSGGFVNRLRNASCDIAQRGTSGTIASGGSAYTLDGFIAGGAGASFGWSQTAGSGGASSALTLASATGLTDSYIRQRIEGKAAKVLAGKVCTFQALIYNGTAGSVTPTLTVRRAGSLDNWTSPSTDVSAVSLQACAASAWTLVAYSFSAHASAGEGLEVTIGFGGALNVASKTMSTTAWDIRVTESVATGQNSTPPAPELRPIGMELPVCQRHFQKLGGETGLDVLGGGYATSATSCQIIIPILPVKMRSAPTLSYAAAGNFTVNTIATANAATSITASSIASHGGITLTVGSTGMTTGNVASLRTNIASDALIFTAEL